MIKRLTIGVASVALMLVMGTAVFAQTATPSPTTRPTTTTSPSPTSTLPGGAPATGFGGN